MLKKTMRRLTPEAREIAALANDAASVARRLKNLALRINDARVEATTPGARHVCNVVGCINRPLPGRVVCPAHT